MTTNRHLFKQFYVFTYLTICTQALRGVENQLNDHSDLELGAAKRDRRIITFSSRFTRCHSPGRTHVLYDSEHTSKTNALDDTVSHILSTFRHTLNSISDGTMTG